MERFGLASLAARLSWRAGRRGYAVFSAAVAAFGVLAGGLALAALWLGP